MLTVYPEVVDALVSLFREALPGVTVEDGPPLFNPSSTGTITANLYVGWGLDDVAGESLPTDADDLSDDDTDEELRLTCVASVWWGEAGWKQVRDEAVRVLRACVDALASDPKLGGLVYDARVRRPVLFDQDVFQNEAGGAGGVRAAAVFTVTCRRFV